MTELKATPGPWHRRPEMVPNPQRIQIVQARNPEEVEFKPIAEVFGPNAAHDACAIVSFHELYEALERLVENVEHGEFVSLTRISEARAALSKARGE